MTAARPYLIAGSAGMFVGFLFLLAGILTDGVRWFPAHGWMMMIGWVLPSILAFHAHSFQVFRGAHPDNDDRTGAGLLLLAAFLLSIGFLLQPSGLFTIVAWLGATALLAAAIVISRQAKDWLPRDSIITDDPLTKGDDASWKHLIFSYRFLVAGVGLLWIGLFPYDGPWVRLGGLAGAHVMLIGFGLLSLYGLGHLWVPRFSGVPAIAAGAIKGELHTTLLGITGLTFAFIFDLKGLALAFGPIVFLGFFTYMGVLGANIMRNKSITQRVTPEFVYVPWTFAGIFWLVSGVLLGLFLEVVPDALAASAASLRWVHIHINLFGGFILLLIGWSTRVFPAFRNADPPAFQSNMKAGFYLLNMALAIGAYGHLAQGPRGDLMLSAALLAIIGLMFFGVSMRAFFSSRRIVDL